MALNEIHIGDVGIVVSIKVLQNGSTLNLATATTKDITFNAPSGTSFTVPGVFGTDGTDGIITYTTTSTSFTEVGTWRYQVHVVIGVNDWHSQIKTFSVLGNL